MTENVDQKGRSQQFKNKGKDAEVGNLYIIHGKFTFCHQFICYWDWGHVLLRSKLKLNLYFK